MEQKSNLEILQDFAKRTGRKIFFKEEQYPLSSYRKIPRYKRTVYIPNNAEETSYFVLYGDPYATIGEHTFFCGVYFNIELPGKTRINFRSKNIVDKLNPFLSTRSLKTENKSFDSKVVTSGNDIGLIHRHFSNLQLQELIKNTLKADPLLIFSVNETNLDFVPNLKEKSHLGLVNPTQWILDDSAIEQWFKTIESVRGIMMKKGVVLENA